MITDISTGVLSGGIEGCYWVNVFIGRGVFTTNEAVYSTRSAKTSLATVVIRRGAKSRYACNKTSVYHH